MHRWILLLALAWPVAAPAQMVRGIVTDASTGAPVKAADITVFTAEGQRMSTALSDDAGRFELVLPKGITVYLQVARIGYETVKSESISATSRELLQLSVRLSVEAVPLQGVEVVTRRDVDPRLQPFLDRASRYKRVGIGHIWTRAELEKRHPQLVSHVLDYWVPRRTEVACNGTTVFLDDLPLDTADIDMQVAPEQLEGVEIYNDVDVPPDLLMHAFSANTAQVAVTEAGGDQVLPPCKTVMLWRKPYRELTDIRRPRVARWKHVLGAGLLAGFVLLEQIIW